MSEHRHVFIIGAHKAGTTSLAEWFALCPDVSVARSKEPNVFCHRAVHDDDDPWWDEFDRGRSVLVDASTNYSISGCFPGTAERIHRFSPDAHIIYLTRDPMARLRSAWRQHLDESGYRIEADFVRAVDTDPSLVDATRYASQLEAYDLFPQAQVHTLALEQLTADPDHQLRSLARSIGLDLSAGVPALPVSNTRTGKGRDLRVIEGLMHSRLGKPALDALRASPIRPLLADLRRKHLLRPVDQPEPLDVSDELASLSAGLELCDESLRYLHAAALDPAIWPSITRRAAVR